ncbi:MAG: glycosyltransferase family 4 protein [Armatimonadota bacterium]
MKIAFVVEKADRRGGQNRVVTELAQRLSPSHEVHIFCFEAADRVDDVEYHIMPCPLKSRPLMQELWIPIASRRALDPADFDIINAQGGNCFIANTTLVHTSHRRLAQVNEDVFFNRQDMPFWERYVRRWWQRRAMENERRVVRKCRGGVMTVSEKLRHTIADTCEIGLEEITAAPNGIDHDRFHPGLREEHRGPVRKELDMPNGAFVLLFIGARWEGKGLDRVLQAMQVLNNADLHLLVLGRGNPEAFASLITPQLADTVHFLGHQPPEQYYGAADCLVFPSRLEGFGLVMAEAAAAALPLVVTPEGVAETLVVDGESGYLVDGDAEEIAEKIATLAADPQAARRMGQRAHEESLAFTWDRQAEIVEGVFERVAAMES